MARSVEIAAPILVLSIVSHTGVPIMTLNGKSREEKPEYPSNTSAATGTIVLVNGPSSVGKSTLCRHLQQQLDGGYSYLSIDMFLACMAPRYYGACWNPSGPIRALYHALRAIRMIPHKYQSLLEPPPHDKREVWARMVIGFYHTAVVLAGKGNNLLVDTVITDRPTYELCADILWPLRAFFVGLHCNPRTLACRERFRIGRQGGLAAKQSQVVHFDNIYDLELNTDQLSVQECCRRVCDLLASGRNPEAFASIVQRQRLHSR
jgi:chloramphenicol 3-O phosphotransferase